MIQRVIIKQSWLMSLGIDWIAWFSSQRGGPPYTHPGIAELTRLKRELALNGFQPIGNNPLGILKFVRPL